MPTRFRFLLRTLSSAFRACGRWVAVWLIALIPAASGGPFLVTPYGVDDGLPQSSVMDVAQTPDGYLWIGTLMGGISRFDGVRFVNFDLEGQGRRGPTSVNKLFVDAVGRLWVNSFSGLERYSEGRFISEFYKSFRVRTLLSSSPSEVLFETRQSQLLRGKLMNNGKWAWEFFSLANPLNSSGCQVDALETVWYLRSDYKLGRWADGKSEVVELGPDLAGHQARALATDSLGRLWVGTDQGIAVWDQNHFSCMSPTNGESRISVFQLAPGKEGSMWVATTDQKVRRTGNRQWLAEANILPERSQNLPSPKMNPTLHSLASDRQGGVWLKFQDWGLVHTDAMGGTKMLRAEDLPSFLIRCFFLDREGNAWIGYDRGGMVKISPALFQTLSKTEGLADSVVSSVSEGADGSIWIGTVGGILSRWHDGVCTNIQVPKTGRICQNVVACPDARGRLWVGTEGSGAFIFDQGLFKPVPLNVGESQISAILSDTQGRVWVATTKVVFCCVDDKPVLAYREKDRLGSYVAALAEAGDGTIWLGTFDGTLLRYQGQEFQVPPMSPEIPKSRFWTLWPSEKNGLWIGTYDSGLWQNQAGVFKRYLGEFPIFGRVTEGLSDADGNLWLGTQKGIARVAKPALRDARSPDLKARPYRLYGRGDGLLTIGTSVEFQPRCWKGQDGRLWFGMANGVAYVDPKDVHPNLVPPRVIVEEVAVDGETVSIENGYGDFTSPAFTIRPGRHDVEIRFTAPIMRSPEAAVLEYRLRGLDSNWVPANLQRTVTYRNLAPGNYTFEAKAANGDGVPSLITASLSLVVQPHFWQAKWFLPLIMIALTGITGTIIAWVLRRRYRRQLLRLSEQRALELERARISRDLHDELGVGLTQIGLLGDLIGRADAKPDKRFTDEISDRARDLAASLDEMVWAINPAKDTPEALSDYFIRYAQTLLERAGIRCRIEVGENQFDGALNAETRHHLFLAFKEALNNVVTHARATEVHLQIGVENGHWLVRVSDDGLGFSELPASGSPDGLAGMRQRLAQLGGNCEVKSVSGKGTCVTFLLPVKPKSPKTP